MLSRVLRISDLADADVLNVFQYGSRVYGTATFTSDYDFLVVARTSANGREVRNGDFNVLIYTPEQFRYDLARHKPVPLECHFAPREFRLVDSVKHPFTLKKPILRDEFTRKAQADWLMAERRLREQDVKGLRHMWHALRLLTFGTQLASPSKGHAITDFKAANKYWKEIADMQNVVSLHLLGLHLFERWEPEYIALASYLKTLTEHPSAK